LGEDHGPGDKGHAAGGNSETAGDRLGRRIFRELSAIRSQPLTLKP